MKKRPNFEAKIQTRQYQAITLNGEEIARSFDPEQNLANFIEATAKDQEMLGKNESKFAKRGAPIIGAAVGVLGFLGGNSFEDSGYHNLAVGSKIGGVVVGVALAAIGIWSADIISDEYAQKAAEIRSLTNIEGTPPQPTDTDVL